MPSEEQWVDAMREPGPKGGQLAEKVEDWGKFVEDHVAASGKPAQWSLEWQEIGKQDFKDLRYQL